MTLTDPQESQTLDILDTSLHPTGNITINGNNSTIDTSVCPTTLGTPGKVIIADNAHIDDVNINGTTFTALGTTQTLNLDPNGTGTVNFYGSTNVTGNLHATGNIVQTVIPLVTQIQTQLQLMRT